MPDRGELLAYDKASRPRVSGAYTAYPVSLSEEHALRAAQPGGRIVMVSPKGKLIDLAYERHIEHADGNWTWIGRDEDGADAVITFGAKAAFGTIPQTGDESLRLTVAGGRSWLVATDRSKVTDPNRAVTRTNGSDYFIPPRIAMAVGAGKGIQASAVGAERASAVAAAATTTVDVALGYTNGLATALGGQSQAVTRLNNLIDITNQAYARSGINMRVRLVRVMAVNFTDSTDNGDALEKLTGYDSDTNTSIPPDPAFAALRAARNQYGADLVSLVRDFRTPQNNGCGIAWLIGGDQSGIAASDAPFGYSVVSDGSDLDEGDGNTYFCREESLAHEMGHNMGQAHNVEDSGGSGGAHVYSYGYRQASASGFYTIMAYRREDSSQFAIPYFANPAIRYGGQATGVANASDNARSLNQTMPIVSTFRASVMPSLPSVRNDVNGNRKSDILWRGTASSSNFVIWLMNGYALASTITKNLTASYAVVGTGDFNDDGRLDLALRSGSSTQLLLWMGDGAGGFAGTTLTSSLGAGWIVAGVGDVNGDGMSDIVWRGNGASSNLVIWLMNGAGVASTITRNLTASYAVVGTGDVNGDGRLDLALRSGTSTQLLLWVGDGLGGFAGTTLASSFGSGWIVVGLGDVNGDGKSDILWRGSGASSNLVFWLMNGATRTSTITRNLTASYAVSSTGDFNGDGRLDLALRSGNNTQLLLWIGDGAGGFTGHTLTSSFGSGWTVVR